MAKIANISSFHKSLRDFIQEEGIRYVDDLRDIDLEEIKLKYNLGTSNLSTLVRIILENNTYEDLDSLQQFILKYKLKTSDGTHRYRRW